MAKGFVSQEIFNDAYDSSNHCLKESIVRFESNSLVDSFGRLRVSAPVTLWDSKQVNYDETLVNNNEVFPLFWDNQETQGTGSTSVFHPYEAATYLNVASSIASIRIRQSKERFNYQPGKSLLVVMTGSFLEPSEGVTKRFGYYDDRNGFAVQETGSTLQFLFRTSISGTPEDTLINQEDWNVDKLDGKGPSGITLNPNFSQVFFVDFQWLGVGTVRYGFFFGNVATICHTIQNANIRNTTYMTTVNLPIRYEIQNDGTGEASSLASICSTIMSEGGSDSNGVLRTHSTGDTYLTAATAKVIYACLGIQLRATALGATVDLTTLSLIAETNDDFRWLLLLNPTVAATFNYVGKTASVMKVATGTTSNTISNLGTVISEGYASNAVQQLSADLKNAIRLGAFIDNTPDSIVVAIMPLSNGCHVQAALNWREVL